MVLTRALLKDAFKHVLDIVIGKGDGSPLKSFLVNEGIDDMFSFSTLTYEMIESLTQNDPDNKRSCIKLKLDDTELVKVFL